MHPPAKKTKYKKPELWPSTDKQKNNPLSSYYRLANKRPNLTVDEFNALALIYGHTNPFALKAKGFFMFSNDTVTRSLVSKGYITSRHRDAEFFWITMLGIRKYELEYITLSQY